MAADKSVYCLFSYDWVFVERFFLAAVKLIRGVYEAISTAAEKIFGSILNLTHEPEDLTKMKSIRTLPSLFCVLLLTGCAASGPALDEWDIEENESKIDVGSLIGKANSDEAPSAQEKVLEQRIEKLESQAEAESATQQATSVESVPSQNPEVVPAKNSASYLEWQQHKGNNTAEYKEFLEFKKWQEFQEQKKQTGAAD